MASDPGFVEHVCDQLRGVGDLTHRKMFGEYALYLGDRVVALVCDNQLFLKPTEEARVLLGTPTEAPPYPGAKPHFLLDEHLDDRELLQTAFAITAAALPPPKPKRARGAKKPKEPRVQPAPGNPRKPRGS